MRFLVVVGTVFLAFMSSARDGNAKALLSPGFFMEYRVELLEGGKRSEESFRITVLDSLAPAAWRIELALGGGARYRSEYVGDGFETPFAVERFSSTEVAEDGRWLPLDPGSLDLLDSLRAMAGRVGSAVAGGDSLFTIAGSAWLAQGCTIADSSEKVQRSESVTLTQNSTSRGRAWVCEGLPFGGWLHYAEERRARKVSEFGGRRFEGEESRSRETWNLVDLGRIK